MEHLIAHCFALMDFHLTFCTRRLRTEIDSFCEFYCLRCWVKIRVQAEDEPKVFSLNFSYILAKFPGWRWTEGKWLKLTGKLAGGQEGGQTGWQAGRSVESELIQGVQKWGSGRFLSKRVWKEFRCSVQAPETLEQKRNRSTWSTGNQQHNK